MPAFENDKIGLAAAVTLARQALLSQLSGTVIERDMIGEMRRLARSADADVAKSPLKKWLQCIIQKQKGNLLWREQRVMELATALLDRQITRDRSSASAAPRRSLLFLVPFDIADATTGGATRVHHIARELAAHFEVRLLSLVSRYQEPAMIPLCPGVTLHLVPKTDAHGRAVEVLRTRAGGAAELLALESADETMPLLAYWTELLGCDADAIFLVGPALIGLAERALPGKPLIYEAHDVFQHFARLLAGNDEQMAAQAAMIGRALESRLVKAARLVACVSENDRKFLADEHNIASAQTLVVANGVDVSRSLYFAPAATRRIKKMAGFNRPLALFVGSCHMPNVEAVRFIARDLCLRFPQTQFLVAGMKFRDFAGGSAPSLPDNLAFAGKILETDKEAAFALADVAICPVVSGSGSSLKIPDYAAHGKPIVTTAFGLRGFDELTPHVAVAELDAFGDAMERTMDELLSNPDAVGRRCSEARGIIGSQFDWNAIMAPLVMAVGDIGASQDGVGTR